MTLSALVGARIFDGSRFHEDAALIVRGDSIEAIASLQELPPGVARVECDGLLLAPGFVDWQVNGGGGTLFNDDPTADALGRIAAAHRRFGTTALLPTVITDRPAVTDAAAEAAAEAVALSVPGIVGIHFEGPHLSVEKRGVHDPALIRPLEEADRRRLTRGDLGRVLTTLAPECVGSGEIAGLAAAGTIVSVGHSNADYATACEAFAQGARAVTHLFNAMSPLQHREPGVAGAALDNPDVYCGLIADGHHVHPAALRLALAARPADRMTLVTDAMSTVGSDAGTFTLNGRTVTRAGGRLTVEGGTLAGSDLDMASAVRFTTRTCGRDLATSLRMASLYPAELLGLADRRGHFGKGAYADIVALDRELDVRFVWYHGAERPN